VAVAGEGDNFEMNRRMDMRSLKHVVLMAMLALGVLFAPACKNSSAQVKFATPQEAAVALHQALKAETPEKLQAIFGREYIEAAGSGDPVSDQHDREVVALAMEQSWRWAPHGANGTELIIGDEQWPFPVPLVKTGNEWQFDSEEGKEEILARRIGRNELRIIDVCRAYARMQKEYASQPHDGKPAGLFAQRFRSSPGRQDGLYWQKKYGERRSPLDELVAAAVAEGYDLNKSESAPFYGYYIRMLTAQGPTAPGGKKSYVINGDMSGGFALLAYPAKYAFSGVMTFIVNQDGVVYQRISVRKPPLRPPAWRITTLTSPGQQSRCPDRNHQTMKETLRQARLKMEEHKERGFDGRRPHKLLQREGANET
jgi:hypothetical protein